MAGYARRKDADMALSALQDFFELGGQPDAQMFDTVLDVCVRTGHFRRAMQAGSSPPRALSPRASAAAFLQSSHMPLFWPPSWCMACLSQGKQEPRMSDSTERPINCV